MPEWKGEKREGFFAKPQQIGALGGSIRGENNRHGLHHGSKADGIRIQSRVKKGKLLGVKLAFDRLGAAKVQHAEVFSTHEKISRVGIGVKNA